MPARIRRVCFAMAGALLVAAPAVAIDYRGLTHAPLGGASLAVNGSAHLVVSNIGSSGADGVHIDLGVSEQWLGEFALFDTGVPTGASLAIVAGGVSSGPGVEPLGKVQFTDNGANVSLAVSYPVAGAQPLNVAVYVGDTVVSSASGLVGTIGTFFPQHVIVSPVVDAVGGIETELQFLSPTLIELTGQPPATGDRIVITATGSWPITTVESIDITGTNVSDFTLRDERISKLGKRLTALGQATLDATGVCPSCSLTVGNIGSSGNDGVRVEYDAADGFVQSWKPITDAGTPPNGAWLEVQAVGTYSDVPDTTVSSIRFEDASSTLEVSVDSTAMDSRTHTVQVLNDGVVVATFSGLSGPVIATLADTDWPDGVEAHARMAPSASPSLVANWTGDVLIQIVGGTQVLGDKLVAIAEFPNETPSDITAAIDHSSGIPHLILIDLDIDPDCPGDVDGDNDIDLTDVGQMLGNYGDSPADISDGDVDNDNDVDLTDLGIMLGGYGNSCS